MCQSLRGRQCSIPQPDNGPMDGFLNICDIYGICDVCLDNYLFITAENLTLLLSDLASFKIYQHMCKLLKYSMGLHLTKVHNCSKKVEDL